MSQKDKQEKDQAKEKESQSSGQPLSQTITDAHAAGDGALEREKDNLAASDDEGADNKKPSNGEAY